MTSQQWASNNLRKIGCTINPIKRLQSGNTCIPPIEGQRNFYECLWEMNVTSEGELHAIEKLIHCHFQQKRLDNYAEWFEISLEEINDYISTLKMLKKTFRKLEDIGQIFSEPSSPSPPDEITPLMKELNEEATKELFFQTFLPKGASPRKIQLELWTTFKKIVVDGNPYRGIIQWATGTGKTVAMMMLFLIVATSVKGRPFRALLIAPTNDIFETLMKHIKKLNLWNILVLEGHNGSLSSLTIPEDKNILITATHAALTDMDAWDRLPPMTHIHYDEVHRATGLQLFTCLQVKLDEWKTPYLTGTSATPKTCSAEQQKKLGKLFGSPYNILHNCDIDEAIRQSYIAKPRFTVNVISNEVPIGEQINQFINGIDATIREKQCVGWHGGKVIAYIPDQREKVRAAISVAKALNPSWKIYSAVEGTDSLSDDEFIKDPADGSIRILFACQRYREGSDIEGIELTSILMGESIAANILLQIAGRALRLDYPGKEGWCCITRPSPEGTSEDEVLNQIVLDIMDFVGLELEPTNKEKIRRHIEAFFGQITVNGRIYDIDTTINRIQALYLRRAYDAAQEPRVRYETIRAMNIGLGLKSRNEYFERTSEHPKFIEDPWRTFNSSWISWYHFLGLDCSRFPTTKTDWICICMERDLITWEKYRLADAEDLPKNPGEMYDNFTEWNKEFGIEDELVW